MYKRLILKVDKNVMRTLETKKTDYLKIGMEEMKIHFSSFKKSCRRIISLQGNPKSENIDKAWFPDVPCHVFISHSHDDETTAIRLSGLLKKKYDLDCFVDSVVWGHEDDLYALLEKKYDVDENNDLLNDPLVQKANREYCVHSVNRALHKMIDECDCVILLETKNSIPVKNHTYSPWIASEVNIANIIRTKRTVARACLKGPIQLGRTIPRRPTIPVTLVDFLYVTLKDFENSKRERGIKDHISFLNGVYQSMMIRSIPRPRVRMPFTSSKGVRCYIEKRKQNGHL